MNNSDPETHVGTVIDAIIVACILIAGTLALSGCGTTEIARQSEVSYPRVEQQGTFTLAELNVAVDQVFGLEGIRKIKGENMRVYATYRPEDYVAVARQVTLPDNPGWSEAWLCVQYAIELRSAMQKAAAYSGYTQAPAAIGWFGVRNVMPWAGVADGRHALNVYVAGKRGQMSVWVIEPQNGIRAKVGWQNESGEWEVNHRAYPNINHVEFVRLEL